MSTVRLIMSLLELDRLVLYVRLEPFRLRGILPVQLVTHPVMIVLVLLLFVRIVPSIINLQDQGRRAPFVLMGHFLLRGILLAQLVMFHAQLASRLQQLA